MFEKQFKEYTDHCKKFPITYKGMEQTTFQEFLAKRGIIVSKSVLKQMNYVH